VILVPPNICVMQPNEFLFVKLKMLLLNIRKNIYLGEKKHVSKVDLYECLLLTC